MIAVIELHCDLKNNDLSDNSFQMTPYELNNYQLHILRNFGVYSDLMLQITFKMIQTEVYIKK
jgi:hypothetical protein